MNETNGTSSLKKPFSLWKWLKSGKGQRVTVMITFMLAPLLLLAVFTYVPFAKMVQFSFYDMKYIGEREFVGFQNYIEVFLREDIFSSLRLSVYYMGASFVQLGLALFFATMLSFKTKGAGIYKAAMFFPYLISGIAVGFIFKFFYVFSLISYNIINIIRTS